MDQALSDALQEHVFNAMPIRLLKLPEMELIERGDVLEYLSDKLASMTEVKIDEMAHDMQVSLRLQEGLDVLMDLKKRVITDLVREHAAYAILSHTWLRPRHGHREVIFRDAIAKDLRVSIQKAQGLGYQKLANFCRVAADKHQMVFAWMDTICINKDSTSELEESIRSMYRWYRNSSICIVYLAQTTSLDDLTNDRWFTRGWTLQELLAPKKMEFYGSDWNILATFNKKEYDSIYRPGSLDLNMLQKIEDITGIRPGQLWRFEPGIQRTGVAPIMVWAAKRETTRGEDRAYSLMGIFGVSFSIAYGEGAERAFFRLVEAILSSFYNSLAVLNCAGTPVSNTIHISNVLPSHPSCYIGFSERLSNMAIDIPHKPIILTHIGLHIPLVLVHAFRINEEPDKSVVFRCNHPGKKNMWQTDHILVYMRDTLGGSHTQSRRQSILSPRKSDPDINEHYLFGIWNFTDRENEIKIPDVCAAFLLLVDLQERTFSLEKVTSDTLSPRSRIATRDVIVLDRSLRFHEVIEKKDLYFHGLKYLTAYL